tara:strand:+ start:4152 stop:5651 length:1500 start_codon:yes stop_codon:yes gene_type:complete
MTIVKPFHRNTYFENGTKDENQNFLFPVVINGAPSITTFTGRKIYRDEILPFGLIPNMVDTWGRDSYYGVLNSLGNAMVPRESSLKPLLYCADNKVHYALDFVADAWRDFVEKIKDLATNNIIPSDSPWAQIQVYKGWTSPERAYDAWMTQNVFPIFNDIYMSQASRQRHAQNIEGFLSAFSSYVENILSYAGPITFSGFLESPNSTPMMSGLGIEVSKDRYDDDIKKMNNWGGPEFQLIANIAAQYGFSIDQHIPFRLVANLASTAMQEYMYGVPISNPPQDIKNVMRCDDPVLAGYVPATDYYGFSQIPQYVGIKRKINVYQIGNTIFPGYFKYRTGPTDIREASSGLEVFNRVFAASFVESWKSDMEILKPYLLQFYNTFVESSPQVSIPMFNFGCEVTDVEIKSRTTATMDAFNSDTEYGAEWSLKCFYQLRSIERQINQTTPEKIKDIRKFLDIYRLTPGQDYYFALKYIHEEMLGPFLEKPLTYHKVKDILES